VVFDGYDQTTAAKSLAERFDEPTGPRHHVCCDHLRVDSLTVELDEWALAQCRDGSGEVERQMDTTGRGPADPDDGEDGNVGVDAGLNVGSHSCSQPPVPPPGVRLEQRQQGTNEGRPPRSPRSERREDQSLPDTSPRLLLRAWHLANAHALAQIAIDKLENSGGPAGSARITHVLVEQAVTEKHDLPPAAVVEPFFDFDCA
jgi:hypothetical protein